MENNKEGGDTLEYTSINVGKVLEILRKEKVVVLGVEENFELRHTQDNGGRQDDHSGTYHLVVVERLNDYDRKDAMTLFVPLDYEEDTNGYFLLHSYGKYDPNRTKKLYKQRLENLIKDKIKSSTKVTMEFLPLETSVEQEQVDKALVALFKYALHKKVQVVSIKSNYVQVKAPKAKIPSDVVINLVPQGGLYKYRFLQGSKCEGQVHTKSLKDLLEWLSPL